MDEFRVEDVAFPDAFARDPDRVCGFYDRLRSGVLNAEPNPAHLAIARLEAEWPGGVTVVTQNVDDLHERAGSTSVIHIHGSVFAGVCASCSAPGDVSEGFLAAAPCACGGRVRPDIVWFTEPVRRVPDVETAFYASDVFLSVGTSSQVYPAADYARRARNRKLRTVEFNLAPTEASHLFREHRRGPASKTLPAFVNDLLGKRWA